MAAHSVGRLGLIFTSFLVYVVLLFISYLSSGTLGRDIGFFKNNTGDVSDVFSLIITPAGWTFSIWGVIYLWQLLWLIYTLTTICRTNDDGVPVYMLPQFSYVFFVSFIVNNCFVIAWSFLWDRQLVGWSCIVIVFTPLTLYVCLFFSFRKLYRNLSILRSGGLSAEVWLIRIFVQNGIAFFATWVSIATLLNFAIVMRYKWDVNMNTACIIALALLAGDILIWFVLETFVVDKYVRYTVSPYIVLVVGLTGSLAKNYDLEKHFATSVMTAVLLGLVALLAVVKVLVVIYRHRKYPIKGTVTDDIKGTLA